MATCFGDSYVEVIERTECIGNSLAKINNNFAALDLRLCETQGTTSVLNGLLGIIKGDGNGGFLVADPDLDYYIPGRTLNNNLKVLGTFECSGNMTIGEGSIVANKGNISGVNFIAIGNGNFGGSVKASGSLTVEGRGTFNGELQSNSLTVNNNAQVNGALTVGGIFTGTSIVGTTSLTVPTITVAGNPGTITAPTFIGTSSLTVPSLSSSDFSTNKAVIQLLSAYDGVFIGTNVQTTRGNIVTFGSTTGTITTLGSTNITTTNLSVTSANITTANATTLNATTGNITNAALKTLTITNVVNGNDVSSITVGTGNFTTVNATNVNGTFLTASGQNGKVTAPIGDITTVNATTVNANTVASQGNVSGKAITAIGTSGIDGIITAQQKVDSPLINATRVVINGPGTIDNPSLKLDSELATFKMNGSNTVFNFEGANAIFNMGGSNAQFNMQGGNALFRARNIYADYINCRGDIVAFGSLSDKRLKKDIIKISNALDKVSSLQGVEYTWNQDLQKVYEGKDAGVIAQEVEEVLPVAVVERENGYKAVKYDRLIPLLIEAIKELKEQNVSLKEELDLLKSNKCCK